jgi:MFS family permease
MVSKPGLAVGTDTTARPALARAIYVLVLLCLINAFSYLDRNMIGLVLPAMTAELNLSDTITGLVTGLPFALCYATCAIPAAWIADNRDRRTLLVGALTLWSAITVATGAVQNGWQLALARFGLGAGESAGHPTTSSLVADLFAVHHRTAAFAAVSASAYVGPLVGFPLIGWIIAEHGWRWAFYVMGAGGLIIALVLALTVKEPSRATTARGAADPAREAAGFIDGVKGLLSIPSYRYVIFAGGFNAINQGAHITWGASFLDRVHHLGPEEVGFYFGTLRGAAGLIGAFAAAVIVGALVKRDVAWQIRAAVIIALLPFAGDALFLLSPVALGWQAGLALTALSTAMGIAISYTLYVNVAPARLRAQAAALYFLVASLMGFILGPFLVGVVSDALAPGMGDGAIRWAMLAASAAQLASVLLLALAARTWVADMRRAEM